MPRKDIVNAREEGFCRAYVRLGKGIDSYREAFDNTKATDAALYVMASRLLDKDKIRLRIDELRKQAAARSEITVGRVLAEYAKLAFLDVRKVFDVNGNLRPIHELDDATAAAIAGIEFDGTLVKKLKLSDKRGALDSISKTLGIFVERTDHRFVDKDGKDRGLQLSDLDAIVNDDPDNAD